MTVSFNCKSKLVLLLRLGYLKPFLVGAKKTRLGHVSELVLFLSVGVDCNREDCCLPCTINKDQNSIDFLCDVVHMTNDEFDYSIDDIMIDIL